ncbi:glycosyltransferase [Spirosoma sp. HMF4905]|uniref:Glycosyltransferase n=1 Tax=Spirosoma arboris TaxID=2682092 RepID=A0A7K1SEI6_9BACT|nr:glycosyltransferase [Spirosoma arboris]
MLSIIIVSYNSRADLARCLPTLFNQQTNDNFEVIVVDNHGSDGVATELIPLYPQVRLIKNLANTGYAGGNNLGLSQARGAWVLFLNPDTELWVGCLERLMTTARQHPSAFITPKLLNPDGTINACGNQMQYTGITTCRGLNQPATTYHGQERIPLLSGAALLAPVSVLQRIGAFDESYFMYFEDTELSLRARLAGYELWCDADAVVTHYYKLGFSPTKFYYLERNRLLTFLTTFSRATLLRLLPALFITELLMWGFALRGWGYLRMRFRTYAYLYTHRNTIRQRHRTVQALRQVADAELLQDSMLSLPFDQLAGDRLGHWLDVLIRPLYRLMRPHL